MKRFLKTPACLAIFASWVLGLSAHAQTNTNTYYAQLGTADRTDVPNIGVLAPNGNRIDVDRFGDDGSAALVDASGLIVWRTSNGSYTVLSDTQAAKPLFVSNSECILWSNAYETDPAKRTNITIRYFRSSSNTVDTLIVNGNKVLDTPLITTTTEPYLLVTANVMTNPTVTNTVANKNIFVYRLTSNLQAPQVLNAYIASKAVTFFREYLEDASTKAISVDGSQIVRLKDPTLAYVLGAGGEILNLDEEYEYLWIRNDGSIQVLFKSITEPFVNAAAAGQVVFPSSGLIGFDQTDGCFNNFDPLIVPVAISATQFVFGSNTVGVAGPAVPPGVATIAYPIETLAVYNRDSNDVVSAATVISAPPAGSGLPAGSQVLPVPNFTQKGFEPHFLAQIPATKVVSFYRLEGVTVTSILSATLPVALGTDLAVSRLNVNLGTEAVAIRDTGNRGIIWLHNGPGFDQITAAATVNFSRINELNGRPLFVTPGEMILWNNALSASLPNGSLPPVVVKHYGRDPGTGAIATMNVTVLADASDPTAIYPSALRGTEVFTPFPFTQDPELWRLETAEKLDTNTLRIRDYELLRPEYVDEDGDGIPTAYEVGPFYIIPGTFTYDQAVADAKRRGGHLATFDTAAEYARMQTSLNLWQRNSPTPLPKRNIPYPLWIGLELNAPAPWSWIPETLETPAPVVDNAFLTGHWAAGEPSVVVGRIRARMNSAQKWEAVNPANPGGYLLELTATDPLAKDTDGDGASDYDELFRLITDPTVPNFGTGTPAPVLFASPLVAGNYEGFVTELARGPISGFTLSVTSKGAYTGRVFGATGNATLRGSFAADGSVVSLPVNFGSGLTTSLSMLIAPDPVTGIFRVGGRFIGLNGDPLVFELRRAGYSKTFPTPDAGLYTAIIPSNSQPKTGEPYGDGYLTGSIGSDGRASLLGMSSDGQTLTWSGNLLEGDFMSFFAMINKTGGFVGSNLFLRDSADVDDIYGLVGQSDLDGDLLVVRNPVTSGVSQIAGYAFRSAAYGSVYRQVSYAQLPSFAKFLPQPNNAVITFSGGNFDGQSVIATWNTKNGITVPNTQTRTLSASINTKTGLLTGTYRYNDPTLAYAASKAVLAGVVLQKSGEVRGFYRVGLTSGQVVIQPNVGGTPAPYNLLSPKSKSLSASGGTYIVYLTANEPWSVVNPASTWVSVQPMSGPGSTQPVQLVVSVGGNSSNLKRSVDLKIAGLNHHIDQAQSKNGGGVTVSPTIRTVSVGGGSFQVTITGYNTLNSNDFFSPVDWITVTPAANLKSATVTVVNWGFANSGISNRDATITVAGLPVMVIQTWY